MPVKAPIRITQDIAGEAMQVKRKATRKSGQAMIAAAAIAAAALSAAGCASHHAATPAAQPAPTVTVTAEPTGNVPGNFAAQQPDSATPSSTPSASASPTIIAKFSGSGDQNTGSFTVSDTWHLSWAYWGCPDSQDNFVVSEYNTDGSPDINGVSVNELGSGRGPVATTAYGDGGSHYFQVNTEGCSWSLVPVSGQG